MDTNMIIAELIEAIPELKDNKIYVHDSNILPVAYYVNSEEEQSYDISCDETLIELEDGQFRIVPSSLVLEGIHIHSNMHKVYKTLLGDSMYSTLNYLVDRIHKHYSLNFLKTEEEFIIFMYKFSILHELGHALINHKSTKEELDKYNKEYDEYNAREYVYRRDSIIDYRNLTEEKMADEYAIEFLRKLYNIK